MFVCRELSGGAHACTAPLLASDTASAAGNAHHAATPFNTCVALGTPEHAGVYYIKLLCRASCLLPDWPWDEFNLLTWKNLQPSLIQRDIITASRKTSPNLRLTKWQQTNPSAQHPLSHYSSTIHCRTMLHLSGSSKFFHSVKTVSSDARSEIEGSIKLRRSTLAYLTCGAPRMPRSV